MVAQEVFNQLILNQRGLMSILTTKEYFKAKDIDPDTLWQMQKHPDGEWLQSIDVEHMLEEYAKMYALQVAREAVEEVKAAHLEKDGFRDDKLYARGVLGSVLERIESKLK